MDETNGVSVRKKEIVSEDSDWDTNSSDSEADNNALKRVIVVKKSQTSIPEVNVVDAPVKENAVETKIEAKNLPREEPAAPESVKQIEQANDETIQPVSHSKIDTSSSEILESNSSANVIKVKEDQEDQGKVIVKIKKKSKSEKEDKTNGEASTKKVVKKIKKKTKDGVDKKSDEALNNSTLEILNEKMESSKKKEKSQIEEPMEEILLQEKTEKMQHSSRKNAENEFDINQSTSIKVIESKTSTDGVVKTETKEKKKKLKTKVSKSEATSSTVEPKESKKKEIINNEGTKSEAPVIAIDDVTKLVHGVPHKTASVPEVKATEEITLEELQSKIDKILNEKFDATKILSPAAPTSEIMKEPELKTEARDERNDVITSISAQSQETSAIAPKPLIIFDEDKDEPIPIESKDAHVDGSLLKKYYDFDTTGLTNGRSEMSTDPQLLDENELSKRTEELFAKYLNKKYDGDEFVVSANVNDKKYEENDLINNNTTSKLNPTEIKHTPAGNKQRRFVTDELEASDEETETGSKKYVMHKRGNEFPDLKIQSTLPVRKSRLSESETEKFVDQDDEEFYEGNVINHVGEKKFNLHKNKEGFMASFRKEKYSKSIPLRNEVMFQPRRGEETDEKVREKTRHVKALVEKQKTVVDNLRNSMKNLNELETIVKEVKTESLDQKVEHENLENLFDVAYDKYENELGLAAEYLKQQKKIKTDFKEDITNMLEDILYDGPKQKAKRLSLEMVAMNDFEPKRAQHSRTVSNSYDNEDTTKHFGNDIFEASQGYSKKKLWSTFDEDSPDVAERKVQSRAGHLKGEPHFNEGQTSSKENEEGDMTSLSAQDFVNRIRNKYAIPTSVSQTKRKFSSDSTNYFVNEDSKIDAVLENRLKRYKSLGIPRPNQDQEDLLSSEIQLQREKNYDNKFSLLNKTSSQPFLAKTSLSSLGTIPNSSVRSSRFSYGLKLSKLECSFGASQMQ